MNNKENIQGVISKLKQNIQNFGENVNNYSADNYDCKTFVKSIDKYFNIKDSYSVEQLQDGYDIANDFLGVIANSDDSYNKKSHYGTFCGVSAFRANKELPNYFNETDNVAKEILDNLKGKISSEEGSFYDDCDAFINIVSKTLDIKEVYSTADILHGYIIARDIGYYLAKEDNNKDYSNLYQVCDSYIQGKPDNNNYQLLVALYKLKNDLSYENTVNYNNQKAIAEEFKFNSKIDALTKDVASNKAASNSKIDALTNKVAEAQVSYNNMQESYEGLSAQVNDNTKLLQNLANANKEIIPEEMNTPPEANMHDTSDM